MTSKKLRGKVAPSKGPKLKGTLTVSDKPRKVKTEVVKEQVHEGTISGMHDFYVPTWKELLEALDSTDIPKAEYRDSLDTMIGELQSRLDAAAEELKAEAEGEG